MDSYGKEVVLDLYDCDSSKFTREHIEKYFIDLCDLINMVRCDLHFWDYEDDEEEYNAAPDHLKGVSAIQFISTSNITIHTLDVLKKVFLNIFTCKDFDPEMAVEFSKAYFRGKVRTFKVIERD
jgi:S-adenosylmethionine/arginine decarboxylase-like enzyme